MLKFRSDNCFDFVPALYFRETTKSCKKLPLQIVFLIACVLFWNILWQQSLHTYFKNSYMKDLSSLIFIYLNFLTVERKQCLHREATSVSFIPWRHSYHLPGKRLLCYSYLINPKKRRKWLQYENVHIISCWHTHSAFYWSEHMLTKFIL